MTTDLLFKHFHLLADTPGGVQKLRELILQLAVQGRLVPQNPEEEPASVLLEKIREEKEWLVREGKIKKQKPLPEIRPDEVPYELPEGWEWTCFEEVGIVNPRNNLSDEAEVSFIPMSMISEKYGMLVQCEKDIWERLKKGYTHLAENDIVLAKITPCFQNKKSAVLKGLINNYGAGTTELHVLRPVNTLLAPEYALIFLKSPRYIAEGIPKMTGSAGQKRVPKEYFAHTPFPLPPLSEQHRIVSKVDQLMALCDELEAKKEKQQTTHARLNKSALHALRESSTRDELTHNWTRIKDNFHHLFTTPEAIQELRSTILQLAVQGRLVPQDLPAPRQGKWFVYVLECADGSFYKGYTKDIVKRCEEHAMGKGAEWTAKYPPKRIVHWEEFDSQEDAVKREKDLKTGFGRKWLQREMKAGRTRQAGLPASMLLEKIREEKKQLIKEGKIKKQKPLPEIRPEEVPFDLPEGWKWVRLGDLSQIKGGFAFKSSEYTSDGVRVVRISDFDETGFKDDSIVRYAFSEDLSGFKIEIKDILMAMTGGTVGKSLLVSGLPESMVINQRVALIRMFDGIISEYIYSLIRTNLIQDAIQDIKNSTNDNISMRDITRFLVPLPPLPEQHRIVAKVDHLMSFCEELESNLFQSQTDGEKLTEALVAQLSAANNQQVPGVQTPRQQLGCSRNSEVGAASN